MRKVWIVAGISVAVAGCGGGADTSTVASTAASSTTTTSATADTTDSVAIPNSVPDAAKPVTELAAAVAQVGTEGDCADAVRLINEAVLPDPENGESPSNCKGVKVLLAILRDFKASDSAEFGSAAIIEGTSGGNPIAIEAALDMNRDFKLTGGSFSSAQVGTAPSTGVDFQAPADAFIKAVRDGDCKAAHGAVSPDSRLAYASENEFCSVFDDNFMVAPAGLGARLQADPGADLIDLGGTRNAHFFGIATQPAGYRTIIVGTVDTGDPLVFDSVPVER
jgi:hypothetical protein